MKGKYLTPKKKKKQRKTWVLVLCLVILAAAAGLLWFLSDGPMDGPEISLGGESSQGNTTVPQEGAITPGHTVPEAQIQEHEIIPLASGLEITRIDDYAGMYMEDGSNEIVSNVMMIIVRNTTENDLQLARILLEYPELTAHFEVTNLPAGASVVLLEKNRTVRPSSDLIKAGEANVTFFSEPMDTLEDMFEITALDGALNVKNISGQDIESDIYIYYKNSATDLFYGGITYRVRIEGGMKADEIKQVMTGHFSENGSLIVQVTAGN